MKKQELYYSVLGFLPTKEVRSVTIRVISESRKITIKKAGFVKTVYPKELEKIFDFFGYEKPDKVKED